MSKEIIAAYRGEKAPADEVAARKLESLSWVELPGGMTRVRADLSPGDAAVFAHAVEALAKPRPGTTSDGDVVPEDATTVDGKPARTHGVDQRSPGKRRADALGGGTARTERSEAGEIGKRRWCGTWYPGECRPNPYPRTTR
ncbi:DUF222 domain-containing protein [Leekyejoonella antrihumi]|uniref:DUF222 domain-containing protein n=1 Tax=Leekyejoonella antrihumi TaxID=1660198 RepID=UPI001644083C|nr:DUF222 domain-containing protein [Leekyejoonella antrihumi]